MASGDVEMTDVSAKPSGGKKRFELKKWTAVALWSWDLDQVSHYFIIQ